MRNEHFEKPTSDGSCQPSQWILDPRRRTDFITPIPKAKKQKAATPPELAIAADISVEDERYTNATIVNALRD